MYVPYKAKKLAMSIDLERLRREVRGIPENWWVNHRFDGSGHDVVLLMTQYGTLRNLDGTANHSLSPPFEPTEYLAKLPYVAQVLHSFGVSPSRSRLMRVGPGARVKPHQDRHPHWNNKVRIHIPVFTDLRALFHIWSDSPTLREADHVSVHFTPGEAWVFNSWYFHAVTNGSNAPRIHLTGDFEVTDTLRELLFDSCSEEELADLKTFRYPAYAPNQEVARWARGNVHPAPVRSFDQILVHADLPLSDDGRHRLQQFSRGELIRALPEQLDAQTLSLVDSLIVGWDAPVPASLIKRLPRLEYLGVRATSLQNVDVAYLRAHGIAFSNIGGYAEVSTSEFVFYRLFAYCRERREELPVELTGKSIGLIGAGAVALAVGNMASTLGMRVSYFVPEPGRRVRPQQATFVTIEEIMQASDFISFHSPAGQVVATSQHMDAIRPGTLVLVTTIGLPFHLSAMQSAAARGVRFILDRCALSAGSIKTSTLPEGITILNEFAARTVESRQRAEDRLIENLQAYLHNIHICNSAVARRGDV